MNVQVRAYTRVTPTMMAEVVDAKTRLGTTSTHAEIAEETGYPVRTVRYILTKAPLLRRMEAGDEALIVSLKARILDCLKTIGEAETVGDLRRILGYADDEHNIVHVLHSLRKEGSVDFATTGHKKEPVRIVYRKKKPVTRTEAVEAAPDDNPLRLDNLDGTTQSTVTDTPDEVVKPDPWEEAFPHRIDMTQTPEPGEDFPLLDGIIEREYKRRLYDDTQTAYLKAADALKGVDDEAAAMLLEKGAKHDQPYPTPLEAEYLKYALEWGPTVVQPEEKA